MRSNSFNDYLSNPNIRLESGRNPQPNASTRTYWIRQLSVDLNDDDDDDMEEEKEEDEKMEERDSYNDNSSVHIDPNCDFVAREQHVPFPPED